ncbi:MULTISPECIES: hypothetical protein [Lysinibacillus]|nr:hypothetical protein [Lysinibacillus sp. SDF0037]
MSTESQSTVENTENQFTIEKTTAAVIKLDLTILGGSRPRGDLQQF